MLVSSESTQSAPINLMLKAIELHHQPVRVLKLVGSKVRVTLLEVHESSNIIPDLTLEGARKKLPADVHCRHPTASKIQRVEQQKLSSRKNTHGVAINLMLNPLQWHQPLRVLRSGS